MVAQRSAALTPVKGDVSTGDPVLVRVHSSCATGDIFGSLRCDCGEQLRKALQMIETEGRGAVVYLNPTGRPSGAVRAGGPCRRRRS